MTQAAQTTGGGTEKIPTGAGPRGTSITVLLVDDNDAFADLVSSYLEREHGFEVHTKTNGQAVLDHLESTGGVDCVVSDYEMPGIDGLELLKTVKSEYAKLPFVMFAKQGSEELAGQAIQHGADDYLQKDTGETRYELLATRIRSCVTIVRQQRRLHQLHTAIENAGHAMFLTDQTGTITYANPIMEQVSGYESEELIGETPAILNSGEHGRAFYADLWGTITSGDTWTGEVVNERKDGSRYVIDQTISPITAADGKITGFVAINKDITDRKERERELRLFREAVEHAGHGVMITDRDGTIEYVNNAFESMTGYDREEAHGETPAINKSGEQDQEFYAQIWETILDGEVWEGELLNERKNGDRYIIDQTIAPITAIDGEITGFVAINRDITDRRKRERNLTFLKRAVDQAGIGLGTYDETGALTYVNQRLAEITGSAPSELEGTSVTALNPEFDPERFESYWESFEDGDRRVFDGSIQRLDADQTVPAEIVSSRVRIDGESYQVSSVRDTTERDERERELRMFRKAVERAGHGVMITDSDGTIEYVNEAFLETSGYSRAEVVGETPALLKSGEHDREFYADLWSTILNGDVWRGEVTNERKNGRQYIVDQTIAPITDEAGQPTEFVAINNDITELKEYERELEAQNEYLEQYGETVAHDLRNPLTLLASETQRLQTLTEDVDMDSDTKASLQDSCQNAQDVLDQMGTLIDDLLTMSKQGQVVLDATKVNLETVATDAWKQIDAPNATFSVDETTVEADPDRLQELLSNLLRNAIEHGGQEVTVRIGPLSFSEGFYVEDDGPGIPEQERERVLERGYTTADDGTGFGLAIVSQIAQAHNWAVSITESSDGGARFEFQPIEG